jgi:hypothetical protein
MSDDQAGRAENTAELPDREQVSPDPADRPVQPVRKHRELDRSNPDWPFGCPPADCAEVRELRARRARFARAVRR